MIVLGIDPGRLGGTGLALIGIAPKRVVLAADTLTGPSLELARRAQRMAEGAPDVFVGIEIMNPMGAAKFNAGMLANAQFVGELIGRLEERGFTVVQVTKREALAAIGCKGKAPESRVRRCVEALFGSTKGMKSHAVDAVAAACAASMKVRARKGRAA